MWEVLSGQQPFGQSDAVKTSIAIVMGKRPTPELTPADLVRSGWTREHAVVLVSLVKRCWAQDPNDRPKMEAVQAELRPLLPPGYFPEFPVTDFW